MNPATFSVTLHPLRPAANKPSLAGWQFKAKSHFLSAILALAGLLVTAPAEAQTPIESVEITADGEAVTFKTHFEQGEMFLLKATGAVFFGQEFVDAEYAGSGHGLNATDLLSDMDVGLDVGLKAPRVPKGVVPGRMKWFGGYRADHTYYLLVNGNGEPLTLKFFTGRNRAGKGAIRVSLFRLSPLPENFPKPIETLQVSVLQETVQTTLTASNPAVYLLQASGSGKVGGGGLGRGDAEYMDYKADGSGQVDIGDGNVDYGLGVDEADIHKTPRQNWWGPWRKDQTYFMLFTGTGQPIHFHYYDVGYQDNSSTDRLTVKIFPTP